MEIDKIAPFHTAQIHIGFADLIIKGIKTVELRKSMNKDVVSKNGNSCHYMIFHDHKDCVFCFCKVLIEHYDNMTDLWDNSKDYACVSKKWFDEYFEDSNEGYRIEIVKVYK